jgi:hypothetical protein
MLVSAIRRGAKIKEKIVAANLTGDAAYAIERHMIGTFHKNHPGQLWNTIDERFMSAEYLPAEWSNPVHPLYKVRRPLTPVDSLNGEDTPRFFGQVIPSAPSPGRHQRSGGGIMTEKSTTTHGEPNSPAPKSKTALTESKETMREKVMKRSLTNPRFKLVESSGKGFVIVGSKP